MCLDGTKVVIKIKQATRYYNVLIRIINYEQPLVYFVCFFFCFLYQLLINLIASVYSRLNRFGHLYAFILPSPKLLISIQIMIITKFKSSIGLSQALRTSYFARQFVSSLHLNQLMLLII